MELLEKITAFKPIFAMAQLFGITVVALISIWSGHYLGGFAWQSNPGLQFNWHPLLMTIGMVYLYGNGILMYRINPKSSKIKLKMLHAFTMLMVLVMVVIGLKAVFDSHDLNPCSENPEELCPIPNMFSYHSWIGLTTVVLFAMQWFLGFATFLLPGVTLKLKANYLPSHTFFGIVIFICACVSVLLGMIEQILFFIGGGKYTQFHPVGVMANCIAIFVIIFVTAVVYLATNARFNRQDTKPMMTNNNE